MRKAIIAGMLISFGCIVNLRVGGVAGALLFSLGLITILIFGFNLFTGKAGLLPTKEISILELLMIWLGNFIGCLLVSILIDFTPLRESIVEGAANIALTRHLNGPIVNIIYGFCCGLLMYIAVTLFKKEHNPLYAIMPVAVFILSGYNHCIADMFYISVANNSWLGWLTLIPTTIGNIIGCCFIPIFNKERR